MSTVTPSLGDRFVALFLEMLGAITAGSPRHDFAHLALKDGCISFLGLLRYEWRIL
jgi:hypothetical protein